MQNPVPLPKRPLGLFFSTSLPRFGGDFSGSFVPDWHSLLNTETKIPVRWIGVSLDDPAVQRRGLSKKLFIRYMWPRPMQVLGHGGTKQIFRNPGRLLLGLLCLPGLFIITPLALHRIYRRLLLPRASATRPVFLWSHFIFPSTLLLSTVAKTYGSFHIATAHSSDVHLLSSCGPLGRFLARHMLRPDRTHLVQTSCRPVFSKLTRLTGAGPTAIPFIQPMLPRQIDRVAKIGSLSRSHRQNQSRQSQSQHQRIHQNQSQSQSQNQITPTQPKPWSRELRLLYIGSMHPVKGIADYVHGLEKVVTEIKNQPEEIETGRAGIYNHRADMQIHPAIVRILIIGDGPDYSKIAAAVERLTSAAPNGPVRIELRRHRVPKNQMLAHLAQAHFILVPSQNLAGFSEGLPVTALEALAAKRPILATNTGGLPDLFSPKIQPGIMYASIQAMAAGTVAMAQGGIVTPQAYQQMQVDCGRRLQKAWNHDFLSHYKDLYTQAAPLLGSLKK